MLASMSNELQRRFEKVVNVADIHFHLKELYGVQTRSDRHATIKELMTHACVMGLRSMSVIELSNDILLLTMPPSFDGFEATFNMHMLEATLEELVNMLIYYEATIKKEKYVLLVGSSSAKKKRAQNRGKKHYVPLKNNKPNKKPYNKSTLGLSKPDKS
ncbi:uncharacterized protein [Primulina eburnea]|uniref:uncharacterized protein n=1 Tax=Primulina eburnea TaxID=1245227 RepID=UPI003C6BF99A